MHVQLKRAKMLVLAAGLVLAACKGSTGDTGPQGNSGQNGAPGTSTGTITGSLTYKAGSAVFPATNVTVSTIPDAGVTDVTDAQGAYELAVPIGVYSVKFSGNGFATLQVDGVSVAGGLTSPVSRQLTANNPLVVTAPTTIPNPALFGAEITLGVNVSGGTAPYTYTWTPRPANPTAVTLSDAAVASPTFTTGTLAAIIASNKVVGLQPAAAVVGQGLPKREGRDVAGGPLLARPTFLGVSVQQLAQMTYNFDCKVKDAQGWEKTVTVAVVPGTIAQGNGIVPRNTLVAAYFRSNATAQAFTKPTGSTATLNGADTEFPWFVPDVAGTYGVGSLSVVAANFTTAKSDCGGCHQTADLQASVAAKFKAWNNSAHGNHFFKFMKYDDTDALVFKTGVTAVPTVASGVMWAVNPAAGSNREPARAMTTFEYGIVGGEGTHYNFSSCVSCHTVGFNTASGVVNNGLDDAVRNANYSWPDLGQTLTDLIQGGSDNATPAPQSAAWRAMPDTIKGYAGMQCESCHGPLGQHFFAVTPRPKPVAEFDVAACAICHDRPTNHDRVALWRQSGHADLTVAIDEAGIDTHGGSESCGRCHAAQGFVQYVAQLQGACTSFQDVAGAAITDPALFPVVTGPLLIQKGAGVCQVIGGDAGTATRNAADAYLTGLGLHSSKLQAITCGACHDAHATTIRVSGDTGLLAAGFQVNGAGSGALCMTCHNTRNGARGDAWGDATKGAPIQNGARVTSIGGPHEANQTDQLAGSNAYWMPEFTPSAHLAVSETCVGCHMILHPDSVSRNGVVGVTNTNHTFSADATICKHCHGEEVNGEALHGQFTAAFVATKAAILAAGKAQILSGPFAISTSAATGKTARGKVVVDPAVTTVTVTTFKNGRSPSFVLGFSPAIPDPADNTAGATTTTATVSLGNFFTVSGGVATSTKVFDTLFGRIAKANWNLTLVGPGDPDPLVDGVKAGKNVFHNPKFMFQVLAVTKANVGDATKGAL